MGRSISVIGSLSHGLKCFSVLLEKGSSMLSGQDSQRTPTRHSTSLISVDPSARGPRVVHATFGPSRAFIVSAETMADLADRDPEKARLEIVQKLHSTCSSRVYGFLRKSVSPDIADDLTQETFLKLLQVRNLERKSISISYFFRIAQNLLRRRFNVSKRKREILEKVAQFETPGHEKKITEPLGIESIILDEALEGLEIHEQDTIRLIICDGLSYTQAARVLDVPVSTINNWKHRALHKLRGTIDAADSQHSGRKSFSTRQGPDHDGGGGKQAARSQETSRHPEAVPGGSSASVGSKNGRIRVAG